MRFCAERAQRGQDDVRRGLAREAVSALHLIEVLQEAELVEDRAGGRGAFSSCSGFARVELGQPFHYAGIQASLLVAAAQVRGAVVGDELFALLQGEIGEDLGEALVQMQADEAFQIGEIDGAAGLDRNLCNDMLDCAADVQGGVQQGTVYVEQIDRKTGDAVRQVKDSPLR